MLSIDEAIEREKNLAGFYKHQYLCACNIYGKKFIDNNKLTCLSLLEEHEQLAQWLEELKSYKEKPDGWMCDEAEMKGYNKAIDDFADKFISLCDDGEFMARLNEFSATTILEMAEQLKVKEGASNGADNQ